MLSACAMAQPVDGDKPFRFEDYKSQESFQAELERRFPVGSDFAIMKGQLMNAGAKYRISDQGNHVLVYKKNIWWSVFASWHWGTNTVLSPDMKVIEIRAFFSTTSL